MNIFVRVLYCLDFHVLCDSFLIEYNLNMNINDLLNPAPGDGPTGGEGTDGNNPGPGGNEPGSGNNDTGSVNNTTDANSGENMRDRVESKFRLQYDYNKDVSVNNRPDVYSHEGAAKLDQNEIDYIHKYAHLNPKWHYSINRNKLLRKPGNKAATGIVKVTKSDLEYLNNFPKK